MAGLETHYSAHDIEARILAALRAAGLNPEERISPEQLGALDHFHTGGLRASRELLELAQIRAEDRVLDVGAGLAGPARMLASTLGCRVAFQEMAAGTTATSYFPLPWATDPADNFLVSVEEMRSLLGESGFITELLEDTSDAHLKGATANATPAASGQLGLAVYVDDLALKAGNARRSLEEGQVRLVRGVLRVK